ncbi:MAG: hypothetical protein FWE83_10850, partial [Oscillospiraceae bacterium]|nr:hypothetical protein [Oscillospiraceae bacterium]
ISQPIPGHNFRDILASNGQNSINIAVSSGSQRDKIMDAINQARIFTPPAFTPALPGRQNEPFNIRNHYTMPPEEVRPLLKQLEDEFNTVDFFGMSGVGVYNFIENRFIEAFGEDFMMGFNLLMVVPGNNMFNNPDRVMSNYEYVDIGHSFRDMVSGVVGYGEMLNINRTRLFGDMSNGDITDAVIAKYPQAKTNRHLALIESELRSVGIDSFSVGRLVDKFVIGSNELPWDDNYPCWTEFEERWNKLLDGRADVQRLAALHNEDLIEAKSNPRIVQNVMRTKDLLLKLGAVLGPDGLFIDPDEDKSIELNVEISGTGDLIDDFLKDLKRHDNRLRETRELREKSYESKEAGKAYESTSENYHNKMTSTSDAQQA